MSWTTVPLTAQDGRPRTQSDAMWLRCFRKLLLLFWICAIATVMAGNVREHPVRVPLTVRHELLIVMPQGWSFFTRNPREPVDTVYVRRSDGWRVHSFTNNSVRNLLGISREARGVGIELQPLLRGVAEDEWTDCNGAPLKCLTAASRHPVYVESTSLLKSVCGDAAVVRGPPVPWAWSREYGNIEMPAKILRLHVNCGVDQYTATTSHG